MKFYKELFKLIFNILILKKSNGEAIKIFCKNNGLAYIKLAQILATQNYGTLFTEADRKDLENICDNINPLPFSEIKKILEEEYGNLSDTFLAIDETPLGSASISQVHKATLKDGQIIALKIKRKDITSSLEKDIKKLRKIVLAYVNYLSKRPRLQKLVKIYIPILYINNKIGFTKAFELYYSWILEETDFLHEANNIHDYTAFANQVNGTIPNTIYITLPKVYDQLCSENIIAMEYIPYPTFNHNHDEEAKKRAINNYFELSFYAVFHNIPVIFHGDPHGGNIYLDNLGNIGFLDMGLLVHLNLDEIKLTKQLFLGAYTNNYEKLFNFLLPYANFKNEEEKTSFKNDLKDFCSKVKTNTIASFFVNMINVCLKYDISPPEFLFCIAKAFVALNGISYLANNTTSAFELLKKQTLEYLLTENINSLATLSIKALELAPSILHSGLHFALTKTFPNEEYNKITEALKNEETRAALNNALDFLHLLKTIGNDTLER